MNFISKRNIIIASLVLFFLLILFFLTTGKDSNELDEETDLDKEGSVIETLDPEIEARMTSYQKEMLSASNLRTEKKETNISKINEDFKSGELSEMETVKLRLTALTEPELLPEKYQADLPEGRSTLNQDIKWVLSNWETLSDAEKQDFRPYILLPDEEGSVFYPEEEDEVGSLFIPSVQASETGWYFKDIYDPGEAEFHYFLRSSWSEEKKAESSRKAEVLKKAFNDAWPKYSDLLGVEPDEKISIYLNVMTDYGAALMKEEDGIKKCKIYIKKDEDDKTLKASLVHELFHCFQYELSERYEKSTNDINWLAEATAVWSENYIYPSYNTEQLYLESDFFHVLSDEFMMADGSREYGHYMWFFFVTDHYPDDDDDYVAQVLIDGADSNIREALQEDLPDYEEAYRQFAYYNWNSKPFLNYKDTPEFPQAFPINALTYEFWFNEQEKDFPVKLEPGAMKYFAFAFDSSDQGDHHAVFDFAEHGDSIGVTALIRQDGNAPQENWSQAGEKKICITDHDTSLVILAIANSDQKNKAEMKFDLKLEAECPQVPHGYMYIKEEVESPIWSGFTEMRSEEILEYNEEDDIYEIVERTATCETFTSGVQPAWGPAPAYEIKHTGSGSLSESYYDQEDRPYRIYMRNGKEESLLIAPEVNDKGWVDVVVDSTGSPSTYEETTCSGIWPVNYDLKPDQITEYGIKGKEVLDQAHIGGVGTFEVEFQYWY